MDQLGSATPLPVPGPAAVIDAVRSLIVLPAYNIGVSELRCCLLTLRERNLLDRLLLVCPPDALADTEFHQLEHIADDFAQWDSLIDRIEAWSRDRRAPIAAVVGIDEELHFGLSRRIADRFGLAFHTEETCFIASNKYLCKSAFLDAGVPTSAFSLLSELDERAVRQVGFPNVLKVMSGTQSQFLFRSDSMVELEDNFARLRAATQAVGGDPRFDEQVVSLRGERLSLDPRRQFLLEGFVSGTEFSCDFIVQSGDVRVIRVTKKLASPILGLFAGYLLLDEEALLKEQIPPDDVRDVCRKISIAMDVLDAVCMVDFKNSGNGITVLESSVRPGFSAFNHLMYEVFGYTSLALMVIAAMGQPVTLQPPLGTGAIVYLIAPEGQGRALDTARLALRADELGIIAIHRFEDDDEESDVDHTSRLRGYAVVRGFEPDDLDQLIATINASVDYR